MCSAYSNCTPPGQRAHAVFSRMASQEATLELKRMFGGGDALLESYSALSNAAASAAKGTVAVTAHAAKGTAALTSTALASTYLATGYAAKESMAITRKAGETTLKATESSVSAFASTTKVYTGKFQSTIARSMIQKPALGTHGENGENGGHAEDFVPDSQPQDVPTTDPAIETQKRQHDVRADHVIFDTSTASDRVSLRREAVAAFNANRKLRVRLQTNEETRVEDMRRLLRQYRVLVARYEGTILSTMQAGAEGQDRLDLAGRVVSDMAVRLNHFNSCAAKLAVRTRSTRTHCHNLLACGRTCSVCNQTCVRVCARAWG